MAKSAKNVKKTNVKEVKKEEVKNKNVEIKETVKKEKHEFKYWHIIAFLLPPVGLVLYLMWRNSKKETAKKVGTATLISAVLCLFVAFSFLVKTNKEPSSEPLNSVATWVNDVNGDESVVTVIASSTCPHCQNLKPVITASASKHNYKLYFFEADTLSEDDYELLSSTIELEGYEGYVPYTFVVNNKKFMGSHTGEMSDSELTEFLTQTEVLGN